MTGLRRGVDPNSTYYTSKPLDFTDPIWGPIKVQTYEHTYNGTENLVQATLQSDNTIYQQFDLDLGPRNVRQTAIDMGVTSPLDGLPAEGLGGLRVGVYAARDGQHLRDDRLRRLAQHADRRDQGRPSPTATSTTSSARRG